MEEEQLVRFEAIEKSLADIHTRLDVMSKTMEILSNTTDLVS